MVAPIASKDGSSNGKNEVKGAVKPVTGSVSAAPRVPAGPAATAAPMSATTRPAVAAAVASIAPASASEKLSADKISTEKMSMSKSTVEAKAPMSKEAAADQKARLKAIEQAMSQIEKAHGKGSIMRLDGNDVPVIQGVSTGALSLDLALGGRGLPKGRVIEVFGPESSGKTTLALTVIANSQKRGGIAAFIDAEHALDPSWAKRLGVNLDELLVSQPDTGEQALEICEMLVRSNAVNVIVIDSVAALIPRAEIEGEMGDSHVGLQARLMSQALRKLTGAIAKSDCIVIFINQLREKIGVMFGSPETTTGGRALKFYASVRVDIRRIGQIKEGERAVGNRTRAKVVKNKIAPPFREAEFDIMFDEGISVTGDVLDMAVADGVVDKAGAWFSYGDTRLGQGREASKSFLRQSPDLLERIRKEVLEKRLANPNGPVANKDADKDDDE